MLLKFHNVAYLTWKNTSLSVVLATGFTDWAQANQSRNYIPQTPLGASDFYFYCLSFSSLIFFRSSCSFLLTKTNSCSFLFDPCSNLIYWADFWIGAKLVLLSLLVVAEFPMAAQGDCLKGTSSPVVAGLFAPHLFLVEDSDSLCSWVFWVFYFSDSSFNISLYVIMHYSQIQIVYRTRQYFDWLVIYNHCQNNKPMKLK